MIIPKSAFWLKLSTEYFYTIFPIHVDVDIGYRHQEERVKSGSTVYRWFVTLGKLNVTTNHTMNQSYKRKPSPKLQSTSTRAEKKRFEHKPEQTTQLPLELGRDLKLKRSPHLA